MDKAQLLTGNEGTSHPSDNLLIQEKAAGVVTVVNNLDSEIRNCYREALVARGKQTIKLIQK